MGFADFKTMTPEKAQEFLRHYLDSEREATRALIPSVEADGIVADFSVASVPGFLKWMLPKVRIKFTPLDESVSKWIRESEEYKRGWLDIDEESKPLVLSASYYIGESFAREYEGLSWSIGIPDMAFYNMPVVVGFQYGKELPPLVVAETIFCRILGRGAPINIIDIGIASWQADVPSGLSH